MVVPDSDFTIDAYVDLSGIKSPRLQSEMRRTLEFIASKPEGLSLLMDAAARAGKKVMFDDQFGGNTYNSSEHRINIDEDNIKFKNYYTTPEQSKDHTAPSTLLTTVWHELEHARDKTYDNVKTAEFKQKVQSAVGEVWNERFQHLAADEVRSGNKSVQYEVTDPAYKALVGTDKFNDVPDDKIKILSIGGIAPEQFSQQQINDLTQYYVDERTPGAKPKFSSEYMQQKDWESNRNLAYVKQRTDDAIFENPVIEKTNAAMKVYRPELPTRYSHYSAENMGEDNPVNSGTLSADAQAKEDAKYIKPAATAVVEKPAIPEVPVKQSQEDGKTQGSPMAHIDLTRVTLSPNIGTGTDMQTKAVLEASPKSTSVDKPVSQAKAIA